MIRFIRACLSGLCFSVFGIGGIIVSFTLLPFVLIFFNKHSQRRILSATIHYLWKAFVGLMCWFRLIKVNIANLKKFQQMRGKIVVANHPSLIDVVILVSQIPCSICVVKGSLFKNFFVKFLIRQVYLSNSMAPQDFMQRATDALSNGYNIIIFPQGTRTIPGAPIHLHRGFAYLQIYSKCDIQPISISNNPYILGKNQPWWDVGNKTSVYTLKLLPAIKFDGKKGQNERQCAINITEKTKKALFS